jgi:energy-coupling factor transporter ATP-binding protein EcfA2
VLAVDHISFSVQKNEGVGLFGPNGAGKTTTIKCLATLIEPTSGEIWIDGVNALQDRKKALERIAAPADKFPLMKFLPLSLGTQLIGKVMIGETPLTQLPLADILFLVGNSAFYFGLGFLLFKFFENVARDRGLLGHY